MVKVSNTRLMGLKAMKSLQLSLKRIILGLLESLNLTKEEKKIPQV